MALGDTWEEVNTGQNGQVLSLMQLASGRLLGVAFVGYTMFSDDDGDTWQQGGRVLFSANSVYSLAQSPSGRVFTLTDASDTDVSEIIKYSDDEGESWQGLSTASVTGDFHARDLVVTPSGRLIVVGSGSSSASAEEYNVYYSDDDGATLTPVVDAEGDNIPNGVISLGGEVVMMTGDSFYAWSTIDTAQLSTDDGLTWSGIPHFALGTPDTYDDMVTNFPVYIGVSGYALAATEGDTQQYISRSSDSGASWEYIDPPVIGQYDRGPLYALSQGGLFWIPSDSVIYFSGDNGGTWAKVYDSTTSHAISDIRMQASIQTTTGRVYSATKTNGVLLRTYGEVATSDPPPRWWTGYEGVTEVRRA